MSRTLKILSGIGIVIALLPAIFFSWSWFGERYFIRKTINFDLPAGAKLLHYEGRSTRFGAEGTRVWVYGAPAASLSKLKAQCKMLGYEVMPSSVIAKNETLLARYMDQEVDSCIRISESDFRGVSVVQGKKIIVVFNF